MPGYADLLSEFSGGPVGTVQAKQASVADATARKATELAPAPSPDDLYRIAAAHDAGAGSSIQGEVQNDLLRMDVNQLYGKYGSRAGDLIGAYSKSANDYLHDRTAYRTTDDAIGDTSQSIGMGVVNGLASIPALALGAVNADAGVAATEGINKFNQFMDTLQSDGFQAHKRANQVQNDVSTQDNAALYDVERQGDGNLVAGLRRIGRDAWDTVKHVYHDPVMLADGVANAAGSMLAGGALGKVGRVAGLAEEVAMPLSIAAMEGSGAYQGAVSDAVDQGASNEDANAAGLEAAAIQAPVAALTGKLVSHFEAHPFAVPSIKAAAGNVLKEGIEEGIQSAGGQLAQNQGIKDFVNPNQDLLAGVGEQVGQGALFGSLSAGTTQAPGIALNGAVKAAKISGQAAATAGRAAISPILDRADRFAAEAEKASPVAAARMTEAQNMAATAAADPGFRDEIKAAVDPAKTDYLDRLFDNAKFDPAEADQTFPVIGNAIRDSSDRFDAFRRVAGVVTDKESAPNDRLAAGIYLLDNIGSFQDLRNQLGEAITKIDDNHPALSQLRDFEDVVMTIDQHPEIAKAIREAKTVVDQFNESAPKNLTADKIETPEGQQTVSNAIGVAQLMPDKISPEIVNTILAHVEAKRLSVTQEQLGTLKAVSSLAQEQDRYGAKLDQLDLRPSDIVSKQITTDEKNSSAPEKSAAEHFKFVLEAVRSGNNDLAQERLHDFMKFAQHMNNVVGAFNQSLANGDSQPVGYQALASDSRKFFEQKAGKFLNPRSVRSLQVAQQTAVDAESVVNMANHLAEALPQLGVKPLSLVPLDQSVMGPAKEIVRKFREGANGAGASEAKTPASETAPAQPVQEQTPAASTREAETTNAAETVAEPQAKPTAEDKAVVSGETDAAKTPAPVDKPVEKAPDIRGKKIDETWNQFTPESGTLGIPRDQMPQIKGEHRGALTQFLEARGISNQEETVPASSLKPTQAEFSEEKIQAAADRSGGGRAILISKDGHLLDGHHQWMAERDAGNDVRVIRFDAPIKELIETAKQMPSVETDPSSGTSEPGVYPNLLGKFAEAFRQPKEPRSRVIGTGNPLEVVRSALQSPEAFREFAGKDALRHQLTKELSADYANFLSGADDVIAEVTKRLDAFLAENVSKKSDKTNEQAFLEGSQLNSWVRGKVLNVTENQGGKVTYNQELLHAATLAGMQWFLTRSDTNRQLDEEDVAKIAGVPLTEVTDDMLLIYNQGVSLDDAKRTLAGMISSYWGVQENDAAPLGYTKGIPEAMAAEVLHGLTAAKLIDMETVQVGDKTPIRITRSEGAKGSELLKSLSEFPSAIDSLVLTEPEPVNYIGTPPAKVAEFQMNNQLVRNTDQQAQALKAQQETPYYFNPHMKDFLFDLGEENILELFGEGDLAKNSDLNVNYRKSLEGKNRTWSGAFKAIEGLFNETSNISENTGTEFSETPIYYGFNVSRVGRMHMLGAHNPQSSKLTREAVLSTRSVLDLTDKKQSDAFMLAIAQHLGVKVHKLNRADSIAKVQKMLDGELAGSVELMHEWLTRNGSKKPLVLSADDIATLKFGLSSPSPAAVHSLLDYARYLEATPAEREKFTTHLYLEADGVTDGPINSLVHMTAGEFSTPWVENVAKGGLFFGSKPMSVNDYVQSDAQGASVDLYEKTTINLKQQIHDLIGSTKDSNVRDQIQSLLQLISDFSPDMTINEGGELEIGRGIAKNPLTVTIYGSGANGIAGKITRMLTEEYYRRLSGDEPIGARTNAALNELTQSVVKRGQDGLYVSEAKSSLKGEGVNVTMSREMVRNLQQNVKHLFVGPLVGAISHTIGETTPGVDALQRATQIQSIFLKHAFMDEYERTLQEKIKNDGRTKTEGLSKNELKGLYAKLKGMNPFIDTGTQTFFMAASENSDVNGSQFARALDDSLGTPGYVYGPANAGVRGTPTMIIGAGDGQMMANVFTMDGAPKGALQVFDGLNMKLTTIDQDSQAVNQAVHSAWLQNPFSAVYESYRGFVEGNDLTGMSDELRKELTEALFRGQTDGSMAEADLLSAVEGHVSTMERLNREIQARHDVLKDVAVSVDHMASAENPYVHNGSIDISGSPTEVAAKLNELYREKLKGETKPAAEPMIEPKAVEALEAILPSLGSKDASGATVIKIGNMRNKIRALTDAMAKPDLELARRALNSKQVAGYQIVYGTKEQTDAYMASIGLTPEVGSLQEGQEYLGATFYDDKLIVLNSASAETLLHELIHASTNEKVLAFYTNPQALNQEEDLAVERLESLMGEWQDLFEDPAATDLKTLVDAQTVRDQIQAQLNNPMFAPEVNKALALNEFMAWVLSNQGLAEQASKTEVKNSLLRIIGDALKALKQLLFGKHKANEIGQVGSDLFSNVRFNTAVLMKGRPNFKVSLASLASFQAKAFGQNDRLSKLRDVFTDKVAMLMPDNPNPATETRIQDRIQRASAAAAGVADQFVAHGWNMNMQEKSTFHALVHTFMTEVQLDPNALVRIQDLYAHVTKQLTVESFMADPESQDPNDRFWAQEKFNAVMGVNTTTKDAQGRTSLLPSFLALANVDEGFREILHKIEVPKANRKDGKTTDEVLTNFGVASMDNLNRIVSGQSKTARNVQDALDSLTLRLMENAQDQEDYITQFVSPVGNAVDKANNWMVDQMRELSKQAFGKLEAKYDQTDSKAAKAVIRLGQSMAAIANEQLAEKVSNGVLSTLNKLKVWQPLYDIFNEMIGRTEQNKNIFDMIKLAGSHVQATRQHFREDLPKVIADKFSRKLTDDEWTHLHDGLAKTDLAALNSSHDQLMKLLQDAKARSASISNLEELMQEDQGVNWPLMQQKAKELAEFMNTGKVPANLLRNAEAIANLYGETERKNRSITNRTVDTIDQLVSLYALDGLDEKTKNSLAELAQHEAEGISFAYDYLRGQRKDERSKANQTDRSRLNHYKGYVPSENQGGQSLIVARDEDFKRLTERGYTRVGDYKGSPADGDLAKRGYYFAPVSGKAAFNQGIMQNVRQTAYGVDPVTGFTLGSMTAGRITDREAVRRITRFRQQNRNATEPLMPIYDQDGDVVAYERSVDPNQVERLGRNTNLAQVLGIWRGRLVEEAKAGFFNEKLIDELGRIWDTAGDRKDEFVNLLDPKLHKEDPIIKDAVSLFTPDTKAYIKETFGTDGFMVRKDMLYDTIGYRAPSVSDVWTGETRFHPQIQEAAKRLAMGVFGKDAYRYMVQAEKLYQNFISDARQTIVVKSIVVPVTNLISNVYQLSSRGVPLRNILSGMPKKTAEIDAYLRGRLRKIQLEAELRAAQDDLTKTRKLKTEIHSIEDAFKRLSIWPLIERGEFNSISEVTVNHDDTVLTEGRLGAYIEKLTDKLPDVVKTAGRYAIISRDTALFHGLQRAVEYGDFIAKAILYDDLVKRQKTSQEHAFGRVTEEFINYDRLPGRARGYLESMGVMWFWNFKLRSLKIAMSTLRNNPLHVLLAGLAPTPDFIGSVGLPIEDNIVTQVANGDIGWSVGPGQGLRAHSLNPWVNLFT